MSDTESVKISDAAVEAALSAIFPDESDGWLDTHDEQGEK